MRQLRMALEDAPGEQIDERFEEIAQEELGVLEHARRLAGGAVAGAADEHRDVPRQDDAARLERGPQRLPRRIVELRVDVGDHQVDLTHPASGGQPRQFLQSRHRGVSGSIGTPISRSGAAGQNSSSQSL